MFSRIPAQRDPMAVILVDHRSGGAWQCENIWVHVQGRMVPAEFSVGEQGLGKDLI